MAHVSKNKIAEEVFHELFDEMVTLQAGLKKADSARFLTALLTDTEKVMLTKRCAAVLMIYKGYSTYKIWNTLNMSQSTLARIKHDYDQGLYSGIVRPLYKKLERKEKFWQMIELISRGGLPSRGKDRWTSLKQ